MRTVMERLSYDVLRPKMLSGDLLLHQGEGLLSWAIMQRSQFSHVSMLMRAVIGSRERVLIAEATYPRGVTFEWASEHMRTYQGRIFWVPLKRELVAQRSPGYETRLIDFMANRSGAEHEPRHPYDVRGVLNYAIPFIKQRKAADYCSELVAEADRSEGWLDQTRYDPEEISKQWMYGEPVEITR